jgi:phosphatidylserine/phosphatidylglycerophosphate/cardiolipin synthase-like enzyme
VADIMHRLGLLCLLLLSTSCQLFRTPTTYPDADGSVSGRSAVKVYFSTPDHEPKQAGNIADQLATTIRFARESVDVAAFELDNEVIIQALLEAKQRGLQVRLVTDSDYIQETGPTRLIAAGVPVVEDGRTAFMHNKFMVIDNKAVWTGSMNFTENCAYRNDNHGLLILDKSVAENYSTKFRWMFDGHKFGGKPNSSDEIPHPKVKLFDDTQLENYFSTHDNISEHITAEIQRATRSVHFLAFSFTHPQIGEAMFQAANRGVEISGVFEKSQAGGKSSLYPKMQSAGFPVWVDANPRNMHHKCIIIDGQIVIAGSYNFTTSAEKSNDENIVIIRNKNVALQFETEFCRVRDKAKSAE